MYDRTLEDANEVVEEVRENKKQTKHDRFESQTYLE